MVLAIAIMCMSLLPSAVRGADAVALHPMRPEDGSDTRVHS